MWVLENEGDVLQGKKLWLRPGKKYMFGRTLSEQGQFIISEKTISRQHLTVEVEAEAPNDCGNASSRSRVILTDLKTKIGTLVNGEQIRGKVFPLERKDNVVSLGRYKHHFHFTWIPVCFTFSFTSKESRADPYTPLHNLLGPLDIKVLKDYDRGLATHLVAKKRNTSKGLQALIDGKYIVHSDSYIKAVVAAATASDSGPAPLEEDFANFPDPLQYLPPKGDEPTSRDYTAYAPDPSRQDMFEGYTFIFYDSRQFDTLLAPITAGRGKALLRDVIPNQTTVDDFVRYVKSVAGEKGLGEFEDGSEGKGVVIVRFNPAKGAGTDWFAQFGRGVALRLDHRLVEQNEFLDAILGIDPSALRKPLEIDSTAPSSTAVPIENSQALKTTQSPPPPPQIQAAPQEPARRGRSRRTAGPRFKGFDDDDFDALPNLHSIPEAKPMALDPAPAAESQSQGLFVSQDMDVDIERNASPSPPRQTRRSRRGRATPIEDDEMLDSMAPAAARFKKLQQAADAARKARGELSPSPPPPTPAEKQRQPSPLPKKKPQKQIDVQEAIRERMEQASAAAEADREAMQEALADMDIASLRNLVQVEEMDVTRVNPRPRAAAQADESERWDDRWNGRRNFKKFRRKGGPAPNARDLRRVIVPLEEVKKKDFGIGDDYWLDGEDRDSREGGSQRGSDRRKGKERQDDVSQQKKTQAPPSRRRRLAIESEPEEESAMPAAPEQDGATVISSGSDVEIINEPPQKTNRASRSQTQTLGGKTSESGSLPSQSRNKRPAATTLTNPAPPKKVKQTPLSIGGSKRRRDASDDDSDDELKFRFRKRG
ncbi:uncharacterized protein BP5553_03148 [Venustampulla echinocandica]|uniref:FHA domain-containing protein n=1 Tax=Venustampulla echinocandica TaxID=2656787 RepID=A0A370TTI9_9HELO|nr:uncharacterized protein BP5553_03148 [Venustampulla echinocandica]RDL38808.1 hypothetical protein BP5553_03148 [Venustampulla echinocandica]